MSSSRHPRAAALAVLLLLGASLAGGPLEDPEGPTPPPLPRFQELWGYLGPGQRPAPAAAALLTDWAVFSVSLDSQGNLTGLPPPPAPRTGTERRHLVFSLLDNFALTHMAVYPGFPVRDALLDGLAQAAAPYDGLQLDFEAVASPDKEAFWSFLGDLRSRLGGRVLSVALPARTGPVDDAFDYRKVAPLVDRALIMAYDEHWSGSAPGPVASLDWGRRVAEYALSVFAPDQVVLGVPLYGRAWVEPSLARAYTEAGAVRLQRERGGSPVVRVGAVPSFELEVPVRVKVFFDDRFSQQERLKLYQSVGVRSVGFWKLGQEDPGLWSVLGSAALRP